LLKKREEDFNQLIQSSAVLFNVILVCLKDLLECHEARNHNRLILNALLDSVSHLLDRVLPVLWEVNLGNIVDNAAEGTPIYFFYWKIYITE